MLHLCYGKYKNQIGTSRKKDCHNKTLLIWLARLDKTIGLIEKGKYNPSLNLCINIAKALDRTLNDLFWYEFKK